MTLDIWKGNMLEYMTVANAILHVLKDLYSLNIPLLFLFFFFFHETSSTDSAPWQFLAESPAKIDILALA